MEDKINKIIQMDCLEYLRSLPDGCADLILLDPPYNMTQNKWDLDIDLERLWEQINRIKKQETAIIIFTAGIFTAKVMLSNEKHYKYDLIWKKGERTSGFLNAKKQPLRNHENILIFYEKPPTYNPQFSEGKPLHSKGKAYLYKENINNNYNCYKQGEDNRAGETQKYPKSILNFDRPHPPIHPTQKPTELLKYLIQTYSNKNDIVLDCFAGSGSLAQACLETNRNFLCCERDEGYVKIANDRLANWKEDLLRQDKWLNERGVMDFESDIKEQAKQEQIQKTLI